MKTGLLPRMEERKGKKGSTFRYHPVGGKPINLGQDRVEAIRKVLDMNGRADDQGTVGQLWREYQTRPEFKRLAESTKLFYVECWKPLGKVFEKGVVGAIRPADIAHYLRVERKGALIAANKEVALLSNLMNIAVERGEIDRNPCREVKRNPESSRDRLVESHEFDPFVAWAKKRGASSSMLVNMAKFSALTGNRRSEFLKLAWPQVDDDVIRIQRAKQRQGKAKRELIVVSEALSELIQELRSLKTYNPMGAVFAAPTTGNAYSEQGFKSMWNKLVLKALEEKIIETRFTFHDLRAHYTTNFKRKYGEVPELHQDKRTTNKIYERSKSVTRNAL